MLGEQVGDILLLEVGDVLFYQPVSHKPDAAEFFVFEVFGHHVGPGVEYYNPSDIF